MKPISTKSHAMGDYIGAVLLYFAPTLFGFSEVGGQAEAIPRLLAVVVLLQALITDYELSAANIISMRSHLFADYFIGAVLALSPWLFGFADLPQNVWLPHLVVGIAVIGFAALTQTVRGAERHAHTRMNA